VSAAKAYVCRLEPEWCKAGKHTACHGDGWDWARDEAMPCPCECHNKAVAA